MQKQFYLTPEGLEKLRLEFRELTDQARKDVARRIKEAKEYGDLSENSEYSDAKDQQAFIEGRIAELDHILKNANIIRGRRRSDVVEVGSVVHVALRSGKMKFRIVGAQEADPDAGKISHESPIGQALLGKKKGDEVAVTVPAGTMKYKIVHIE